MALEKRDLELVLVNPVGEVIEKLRRGENGEKFTRAECMFLTVGEAVIFLQSAFNKQSQA
ncbi:hypothetical protein CASFOL_020532 [Castilleja foliolosa]|uniref:Uncharacterized protein n=1 Tax=Castilleja foliolosa TaxID=1961234 RepID=A0ABD3D152_9LAMI